MLNKKCSRKLVNYLSWGSHILAYSWVLFALLSNVWSLIHPLHIFQVNFNRILSRHRFVSLNRVAQRVFYVRLLLRLNNVILLCAVFDPPTDSSFINMIMLHCVLLHISLMEQEPHSLSMETSSSSTWNVFQFEMSGIIIFEIIY